MIHRRLRDLREENGYSQEGMARVGSMSQSSWSNWEEAAPKALESLAALAKHFGVSADYLLGLTDNKTPNSETLSEEAQLIVEVIRRLPRYRQRDLVTLAEALEERSKKDNTDIESAILSAIDKFGGVEVEKLVLELLDSLNASGGDSGGSGDLLE